MYFVFPLVAESMGSAGPDTLSAKFPGVPGLSGIPLELV